MKIRKKKVFIYTISLLVGFLVGFIMIGLDSNHWQFNFDIDSCIHTVSFIIRVIYIFIFFIGIFLFHKAKKLYKLFEKDDSSDQLYVSVNKSRDYGMVFSTIALIFCLFTMILSASSSSYYPFWLFFDLLFIIGINLLKIKSLQLYATIRSIVFPHYPTVNELTNNILQQDEAELLNEYKLSFVIIMNLSGYILPAIEMILFIYSLITKSLPFSGLIIVTVIHLYIMSMQFKSVRDYYK
ncbi:DUF3169 family protein [Streptococcus zalophi]|uniref:DUF3169 family protein n=1 Tax=Streptococcus zalophi TaxID=640031 RepID=UPI00215BC7F1|nr:DUF3169 family protein [Streptococcus zalophi]MCR8968020.1 DUF3169 family protein [Streptococcus zalophi]